MWTMTLAETPSQMDVLQLLSDIIDSATRETTHHLEAMFHELRDQNDELRSEIELLHSQLHHRKCSNAGNKREKNPICISPDGWVTRCQSAS
eukprot:g42502.t1